MSFRLALHFPLDSQDPLVSPSYDNALEQLCLPITKGGFGLALAEVTAPGGLCSAVVGFARWHAKRNFGLGPAVGRHWGRVVFPTFWPALTNAAPLWTSGVCRWLWNLQLLGVTL